MKKKLLATLVIVIVILSTLFTCVSCNTIFTKNGDREYHQVIATVNYGDMSKDVYRGQLVTYINSYGAQYQQNYGMSIEDIVEYFYNSLTQNALVTLYAKSYIYEAAKNEANPVHSTYSYVDTTKSIKELNEDPAGFLTLPEVVFAIETANQSLQSSYDSIYNELYEEKMGDDEEEETTEEDKKSDEEELAARTVRSYTDSTSSTFDEDAVAKSVSVVYGVEYRNIKYKEITKDFIENTLKTTVKDFKDSLVFTKQMETKIKAEKDKDIKAIMKSALSKLLTNISNNYMSVEEFVAIQMDTTILQSYRENVKDIQSAVEADVNKKYADDKKTAIKSYLDKDAYASALGSNTFTLANQANNYVGVKSILLKFSDEQTSVLNAFKSTYAASKDKQMELRDAMALGIDDAQGVIGMYITDNKGIEVNVSNPFYNAEEDELKDAYTDKNVSFVAVLAAMADNISAVSNQIVEKYKEGINYDALSATEQAAYKTQLEIVEKNARVEAFTQWLYLVNDDSGMFSSDSYLITPENEDTSYVAEYTVLARMLSSSKLGETTINNYVAGSSKAYDVEYTGSTEVLKTTGMQATIYTTNATSKTKSDELKANVYTLVTQSGNTISFIVNDFGIHVIMLTEKYGCSNFADNAVDTVDENGEITTDPDKIAGYVYNMNYIYEQGCDIKYDYTYNSVDKAATFDANQEYYVWSAGEFKKQDITAFEENTTYYTRVWELQYVTCEPKTYKEYLEDTVVGFYSTNALTKDQIHLLFAEIDDELENKYIIKNEKVYNKFIEEVTK